MPLVVAVLALGGLIALGNNWLQSIAFEVETPKLPASFDGYCIVQVSDLHGHWFGRDQVRLMRAIREAEPDLIAVTGDLTRQGRWRTGYIDVLARELRAIAPVHFVTGNHDHYAGDLPQLLSRLEENGIGVLSGESVEIVRGSDSIVVAGIPDPRAFRGSDWESESMPVWTSELERLRESMGEASYTLLLSHRPEPVSEYERLGFDLVLSGHAHGGQVRLPVIGPLYAPNQGWFPRLASGVHRRGQTTIVVSRGLGSSKFPVRVLNRPEVVVIRLRKPLPG